MGMVTHTPIRECEKRKPVVALGRVTAPSISVSNLLPSGQNFIKLLQMRHLIKIVFH